jgi:hypothetical protein
MVLKGGGINMLDGCREYCLLKVERLVGHKQKEGQLWERKTVKSGLSNFRLMHSMACRQTIQHLVSPLHSRQSNILGCVPCNLRMFM